MPKASNIIPINQNSRQVRFERQIDMVFDALEDPNLPIPIKERVAALYTIVRIQAASAKLGGGSGTGASVRKYSAAFAKKDGVGGRKGSARFVARSLDLESDDDEDEPA